VATQSSRESAAGAGWTCSPGRYKAAMPAETRGFSWLPWRSPRTLWDSRNDRLARWLGDPTNDQRQRWVAERRRVGAGPDELINRSDLADPSFVVMGDTGEGDASQYAVVPPLGRVGEGTDFLILASDVVYPAGEIKHYPRCFYRPYRDYPAPIYAVPGNHDWYDGLAGFMRVFCGSADPGGGARSSSFFSKEWLRDRLWRKPVAADEEALRDGQRLRAAAGQQGVQPGPYWALDTRPLRIVGIDTGITGVVDKEQGDWLRRVSRESDKPKLLITGKPLYVNAERRQGTIEGAGHVDEIVREPANRYVAAIGGDIHNYQRYPVRLSDGRVIQYIVAGGGGAFMHATHKIAKIALEGVAEDDFRCYPLRGDSLSFYSLAYDRRFAGGKGRLFIPPDEASALMAQRLEIPATRPEANEVTPSSKARRAAATVFPLPGRAQGPWHQMFSEFFDWNEPPMFKSFLRLDVAGSELRIRCFAATGCAQHEDEPPVEDEVSVPLDL
jgi:calcineurin-like phosphoesterase family protein